MRTRQLTSCGAVALAGALLAGCSANASFQDVQSTDMQSATESQEHSSGDQQTDGSMDDAEICSAYGDVLTILGNADAGLGEGRMEQQEHDGWYRLATRVLDRLPSGEGSVVREAIAELQTIAPAIAPGAGDDPADIRSRQWWDAEEVLGSACDDLGTPLAINMFTGG